MKKMLFVFNPRSGKEQIKGQLMEILDIFTKAGYELRVHVTQKQKDAMDVVARLGKRWMWWCAAAETAPSMKPYPG